MFATVSHFHGPVQSNIIFAGKAGAYPRATLLALPENIRLGWRLTDIRKRSSLLRKGALNVGTPDKKNMSMLKNYF